jgi:hypothetical protein
MAGESLHFEVEHLHKDGHIFSLDVVANKIELDENNCKWIFRTRHERRAPANRGKRVYSQTIQAG